MSKNRFRPITIPKEVKVTIADTVVKTTGPLGNLEQKICAKAQIVIEDDKIRVQALENTKQSAAQQGTMRTLIINMIKGVTKGFDKTLIIEGTGYRAQMSGTGLQLFQAITVDANRLHYQSWTATGELYDEFELVK